MKTKHFAFATLFILAACGGADDESTIRYDVTSETLVHDACGLEESPPSVGGHLQFDDTEGTVTLAERKFDCAPGEAGQITCNEQPPEHDDTDGALLRRLHLSRSDEQVQGRLEVTLPRAEPCVVVIELTAAPAAEVALDEVSQAAGTYCPDVRACLQQHRECLRNSGYSTSCDNQYTYCIGGPFGRFTSRNITTKVGPLDYGNSPTCYRFRKYSRFFYEARVRVFDKWFDGRCVRERTVAEWTEAQECWDGVLSVCGNWGSRPSPMCPF